jgi:hypothetical protein
VQFGGARVRKRFRKKMRWMSPCSSASVLWSRPVSTMTRGHCAPRFKWSLRAAKAGLT